MGLLQIAKKEGETVLQDDVIAEIETDKVVLEVLAPADGKLQNPQKRGRCCSKC